jgi:hypothetical protein
MEQTMDVILSEQAKILVDNMPDIDEEKLIVWVCNKGRSIGGGDVLAYLDYLNNKI